MIIDVRKSIIAAIVIISLVFAIVKEFNFGDNLNEIHVWIIRYVFAEANAMNAPNK